MKSMRLVHIVSLILGVGCVTAIWLTNQEQARALGREDGIIENLSALFYLLGAIACIVAVFTRGRKFLFAYIWLFLCILFLGEETSWFQRIIGYSVPAVESISNQSEFSLHTIVVGSHLIDKQGGLNTKSIFGCQLLFRLGILVYFLIIPISLCIKKLKSFVQRIGYPIPHVGLLVALWSTVFLSFGLTVLSSGRVRHTQSETREMFYAFFIFLYTVAFAIPTKRCEKQDIAAADSPCSRVSP